MIDIEELETLAKAASSGMPGDRIPFALHAMDPEGMLALIAELRALREENTILSNHLVNMNLYANAIRDAVQSGLRHASAARKEKA
jgi:hypothetical protein